MRQFTKLSNTLGPFLGLLFVVILFSISCGDYFLTLENFKIIFSQTVVVAIAALGMTMIIVSGGIDLSVGSVVALTSVVGALSISSGLPVISVIIITIAAGGWIGLMNGATISFFRMNPFIVTLGTLGVTRGVAKWLAGNQTVNYPNSVINDLMSSGNTLFLQMHTGFWIAIVLAVVTVVVMHKTVFGRHIYSIGSNEETARLCGVKITKIKVLVYMIAGFYFGISGLMQLSRLTQGDPTVASGLELDVIAAVVIGGASLNGGLGSVLGSMIGALIMSILRNGTQQMGLPTYVQEIVIGIVIIAAVGLDKLRQKRASAKMG